MVKNSVPSTSGTNSRNKFIRLKMRHGKSADVNSGELVATESA